VSLSWLTDLSAAVQKSGLVVHEVAGWQGRGHAHFRAVDGIVEHHTAGPKVGNIPSLATLVRGRPGLPGPLCNLAFARDGSVYVVAAGVAWHAGVGSGHGFPANMANYYAVGIEAESTGRGDWTSAQLAAWPSLNNALGGHYGFSVARMIAHFEWTPRKIDPYGLPGGMTWLRAASARPTGDDMTTLIYGGTHLVTPLAVGEWRTIRVSDAGNVSVAKGPSYLSGVLSLSLDRPANVRVESYVARSDGKGGFVYYASQGAEDFSDAQAIRYTVKTKLPADMLLRFRAYQLDGDAPASVVSTTYNLDARS
jgi:hypothetical protein